MTDQRRVFDRESRGRIDATAREIFARMSAPMGGRMSQAYTAYEQAVSLEVVRQALVEKEQL